VPRCFCRTEKNDVAALFGAAKSCDTPGISAGMINDMSHVFGKTHMEGEILFRVSILPQVASKFSFE
jgi:hypothetical protein